MSTHPKKAILNELHGVDAANLDLWLINIPKVRLNDYTRKDVRGGVQNTPKQPSMPRPGNSKEPPGHKEGPPSDSAIKGASDGVRTVSNGRLIHEEKNLFARV